MINPMSLLVSALRACARLRTFRPHPRLVGDAGMSTAEYAVGTVAAVAFAAVLYQVVRSGAVRSALGAIIANALAVSL